MSFIQASNRLNIFILNIPMAFPMTCYLCLQPKLNYNLPTASAEGEPQIYLTQLPRNDLQLSQLPRNDLQMPQNDKQPTDLPRNDLPLSQLSQEDQQLTQLSMDDKQLLQDDQQNSDQVNQAVCRTLQLLYYLY